MENENQTLVPSTTSSPQMELMSNPFLLLPNLLLMPFYLFAQLISGMFGTMQFPPATMHAMSPAMLAGQPYQSPLPPPQSLPPASEGGIQSSPSQQPAQTPTPRTTYTNTEEWELKRDKSGRLEAIVIHRKATEGSEVVDV